MIPRLKKRSEFLTTSKCGVSVRQSTLILVCNVRTDKDASDEQLRLNVGFTASKRVGNAVSRNRCKRRLKAIVDKKIEHTLLNVISLRKITLNEKIFDFVLIATPKTATVEFSTLCQDFSRAIELCIDRTLSLKNSSNS